MEIENEKRTFSGKIKGIAYKFYAEEDTEEEVIYISMFPVSNTSFGEKDPQVLMSIWNDRPIKYKVLRDIGVNLEPQELVAIAEKTLLQFDE